MKDPFLVIKLRPNPEPDGSGVSICWKDCPDQSHGHEWDSWDQAWTKISNGIHCLLGELGPIPDSGWEIEFSCSDHELIVEKNLTLKQYRNRCREELDEIK